MGMTFNKGTFYPSKKKIKKIKKIKKLLQKVIR
jgi:hypothetical protein